MLPVTPDWWCVWGWESCLLTGSTEERRQGWDPFRRNLAAGSGLLPCNRHIQCSAGKSAGQGSAQLEECCNKAWASVLSYRQLEREPVWVLCMHCTTVIFGLLEQDPL